MTPFSRFVTRAGALSLGLAALGVTTPARAQLEGGTSSYGVALTTQTVYRFYPDGTAYPFRAANLNPNDINFQDCEDNIVLQFNLTESGIGSTGSPDILQIWAGTTDCTQPTARAGAESPFCWQVYPATEPILNETVNIYARSLTRYIDTTLVTVPNGGNPIIGAGQPETACHTQTSSGEVAITIYFMFLPNTGDATPDASTSYGLNVDMVGPLNPTGLTAGIGDGILLINWTPQVDPTIQGFNIYAEDQGPGGLGLSSEAGAATLSSSVYCRAGGSVTCHPHDSGSTDADVADAMCSTSYPDGSAYTEVFDATTLATLGDASLTSMGCTKSFPTRSVSTGAPGAGTCTSAVLVNTFSSDVTQSVSLEAGTDDGVDGGIIDTIAEGGISAGTEGVGISQVNYSKYGVGNVGGNTTSSYTVSSIPYPDGGSGPLIDGHQYAIAVAAYDGDGNTGLLSPLACQTPEPIIDFWDEYSKDGGLAGGGFCALEAPGAPVATSIFGIGVSAALVMFGRRRRRHS